MICNACINGKVRGPAKSVIVANAQNEFTSTVHLSQARLEKLPYQRAEVGPDDSSSRVGIKRTYKTMEKPHPPPEHNYDIKGSGHDLDLEAITIMAGSKRKSESPLDFK